MGDLPTISMALPWQGETWSQLLRQLDAEQLPHAILLAGVRHSGKAQLALALARFLLCHQPESGQNCGKCHACELSRAGTHGDFLWLQPAEPSRVIKIDQVRQMVEFANKTTSLGRRKVIVLSPADSLTTQAANALLKSLEEPADGTYIILVCNRLHALPLTVRSRCQMLKLLMPERDQALQWLDNLTGGRADSEQMLALAGGQVMLAAQRYQDADMELAGKVQDALNALASGTGTVAQLATLLTDEPIEGLLSQLHGHLQLRIQRMDARALASPAGRRTFALLDDLIQLQRVVLSGANPNRQLVIDSLSLRFERELGVGRGGDSINRLQGSHR